MPGSSKPEWDTPPDGDFANYVERLSRPATAPRPEAPVSIEHKDSAPAAVTGAGQPPDLVPLLAPFRGVLNVARALLLLFAVGQVVAFLGWGKGSLMGVAAAGMLWWTLTNLSKRAVSKPNSDPQGINKPAMAQLQERLAELAKQRTTESKK